MQSGHISTSHRSKVRRGTSLHVPAITLLITGAEDLGAASPFQIQKKIILPLSASGIAIGSIFIVTLVMGEFATMRIMSGGKSSSAHYLIKNQLDSLQYPLAAANAVMLLIITLLIVFGILRADGTGIAFDSSTDFKLPNGADRSPDAAWIRLDRWEALTPEQRRKFPPLAPDFVVELRSASDDLRPLQDKMNEYRDNGVRLGWLIDPQQSRVEIYLQGRDVEVLQSPTALSGENVLPGFVLDLTKLGVRG